MVGQLGREEEEEEGEGEDGNGEEKATGAGEIDDVEALGCCVRCAEARCWALAMYLVKRPRMGSEGEE